MPAKLHTHHYDVYLKSRHGTIKRRVGIKRKSVQLAAKVAQDEVQRVIRESVTVADVVPLKLVKPKSEKTVGRGKKQMTVSKIQLKQSRRPKARESVRITNKGKLRGLEARERPELVTPHESFVGKASEKPIASSSTCESKTCRSRGYCSHTRRAIETDLRQWTIKTNSFREVKVANKTRIERMWMNVIAPDEASARKLARAELHSKGIKNVRFLSIATTNSY